MKIFNILVIITIICLLSSCKTSLDKTITDNDVKIKFEVEDISETNLKFGTRSVGWETDRGFHIVMSVENRDEIIIYSRNEMNSKPEDILLENISSTIEAIVSPDKKHIAVSFTDSIKYSSIYHLLPNGEPFTIIKYNELLENNDINKIDWKIIPEPEDIVVEFFEMNTSNYDNYGMPNNELWNAIPENVPGSKFDEYIIKSWPNVANSHEVINILLEEYDDYSTSFFNKLEKRAYKVLQNDTNGTNLIRAIIAEYKLGNNELKPIMSKHILEIWPLSPTLQDFVRENFKDFPDTTQSKIIDKSVWYYHQIGVHAYQSSNLEFLEEFADSSILKDLHY